MAAALYIGIVTDTGKFMYDSTSPATHEAVAELLRAGVDVSEVSRRVYESLPVEKVALLGRALEKLRVEYKQKVSDPYTILLKDKKMPMSLIQESDAKPVVNLLDCEKFEVRTL